MIEMTYLSQPPKKYTFEQPKLRLWVEQRCEGSVLNLFAGKTKMNVDEFRVDMNPEFKPDFCGDAFSFVTTTDRRFKTIILDPPYNLRKAREKYGGRYIGSFTKIKNQLKEILLPRGVIITLGYDTVGMSRSRGFEKESVCVICHNGDHNDTLVVMERMI